MPLWKCIVRASGVGAALILTSVTVTPASAQRANFELTPWVGAYVPTRNTFEGAFGDIKRRSSAGFGARLTYWGTGRVGFEGTFGFVPTKFEGPFDITVNEERRNAEVVLVNGRLLLGLTPSTSTLGVYLSAGGALLSFGGDAFDADRSSSQFGGVAGLGFRVPLGTRFGLRFDVEDYIYDGDFGANDQVQNDLVLSASLAIPLGGGATRQ